MTNLTNIKKEKFINLLNSLKSEETNEENIIILNELENFINEKKYGLIWEQHEESVDVELEEKIPVFSEQKESRNSKSNDNNYNFLLEGDNLHSLYLLEKTHKESVDVIYIDPPYNTGKDFIYNDKRLNKDDAYIHSKWLSFMERRLMIARKLLKKDGFIAISIDENEYANLKLLCNEIFGKENHLSTHHIQVRYKNKSLNEKNDWQPIMEYILIYQKGNFRANRPYEEYSLDKFCYQIEELTNGKKEFINNRNVTVFKKGEWKLNKVEPGLDNLKETWISGSIYSDTGHGTTYQKIVEPRVEIDGLGSVYKIEGIGEDGLGYRYYTNPQRKNAKRGKMFSGVPLDTRERVLKKEAVSYKPIINSYDFSASFGNIRHEGGVAFNSGKKPLKLLEQIINYHPNKNATVLDFFAGSGSTAHAVLSLNGKDNGDRNFIICTNNENNITYDVTLKRLKNITKEFDYNFKHFKTDSIKKPTDQNEYISEKLEKHIKELLELKYAESLEDSDKVIIFDKDSLNELIKKNLNSINKIYIPSYLMLSTKELSILRDNNVSIVRIPDNFYSMELREVGE